MQRRQSAPTLGAVSEEYEEERGPLDASSARAYGAHCLLAWVN